MKNKLFALCIMINYMCVTKCHPSGKNGNTKDYKGDVIVFCSLAIICNRCLVDECLLIDSLITFCGCLVTGLHVELC